MSTTKLFAFAGMALALIAQPAWAQGDPSTEPLPNLDDILNDTRRALVVEALIRSDGTAEPGQILVSETPPRSNIGNPPLLLVEWFDAEGNLLGDMNDWDPRWEFQQSEAGEQLVVLPEGLGTFVIPFSHHLASVTIHDQEAGFELLMVDVSDIVTEFCTQNPNDINCDGFTPSDDDSDGIANVEDNCPATVNPGQEDFDGDGLGDACDPDADNDLVANGDDVCALTAIPELAPTSGELLKNRWALLTDDGVLTQAEPQAGSKHSFTTALTHGCSCAQIVERMELGKNHLEYGCSTSTLLEWTGQW